MHDVICPVVTVVFLDCISSVLVLDTVVSTQIPKSSVLVKGFEVIAKAVPWQRFVKVIELRLHMHS